jgi:hypothetical protein
MTDAARLRALSAALGMSETVDMSKLAYSSKHVHPLRNMHQQLEMAKNQQEMTWNQLVRQNKSYQKKLHKTKIYLTHFLQVINMCIAREEFSENDRRYYEIDPTETRVPPIISEEDALKWGKIVIDGEDRRIREGGSPVMTPTIGKVKAWYEQFRDAYYSQKTVQKSYARANEKIRVIREKTDALILEVWNEVEACYAGLGEEKKRDASSLYGVVYVYRKNEKGANPQEGI